MRAGLAAAAAAAATDASALGFNAPGAPLRRLPSSSRELFVHPFGPAASRPRGFGLFESGALSFDKAVLSVLRDGMTNSMIEMRASAVTGLGLTGSESLDVRFFVGGVPFCERFQARAHAAAGGGMLLFATVPEVAPGAWAVSESEFAQDESDEALALDAARAQSGDAGAPASISDRRKCVAVRDGQLFPEIDYRVHVGGLPWQVRVGQGRVTAVARDFFDVADGKGQAYDFNVLNGQPKDVVLKSLVGDASAEGQIPTMTSELIRAVVPATFASVARSAGADYFDIPNPIGDQRPIWSAVKGPNNDFSFAATHPGFPEVQAYYHVQQHLEFAQGLGFSWYGTKPLEIRLHVKPGGRSNNALYVPGSAVDNTPPTISVDDGDGVDLQNLTTDGDVVSHEFGHHIIYKTLRSTDGQSLVLHEGLADFFAFSRTGDACLGESICPKDSGACIIQGQCLRSAEIPLVYNDQTWNQWAGPKYRLGHLHGQLISGVLWDMRKSAAVPAGELSTLVHTAVGYFKEDSGFRDFMLSLFLADCQLYAGKYHAAIAAAGTARGLDSFFSDVGPDCPGIPQPSGGGNNALPPGSTSVPKEDKKDSKGDDNPMKCGVVGGGGATGGSNLPLLLSLLLPIIAAAVAPVKAKARAKGRRGDERKR